VTGSITNADDDQVVRKATLPEPVKPPADLAEPAEIATANASSDTVLGSSGRVLEKKPAKLFTDRIPQEEIQPAPLVATARAEPAKEPIAEPAAAEAEVIAVETLPEEQPNPATEAAEPSQSETADAVPALTGWSVQISSAKEEQVAWGTWNKLKARHSILAGQTPVVLRADLGSKGIYFRLRLGGFDKRSEAQGLCSKLKARGVSCFVSRANS
jgi:cell division septation protein DedD